jgi:hypothetical protein
MNIRIAHSANDFHRQNGHAAVKHAAAGQLDIQESPDRPHLARVTQW